MSHVTLGLEAVPVAVLLGVLLFHHRYMSKGAVARDRTRAIRWRIRARLRPGPGYASVWELWARWGRVAALHHGSRGRPRLPFLGRACRRTTDFAVRFGRGQYGRRCYGRLEDQVGVLAPQRTFKTGMLIDRILDHPGPVICSSSRADVYSASAARRSRRGPVEVFNPQGVAGVRSTFSWDLLGCCKDEMAAYRMADWLAGATPGYGSVEWFEAKGTFALGALLFAAAVTGHTVDDVYWWVHSGSPQQCEAIGILQARGNRDLAEVVRRLLGTDRTSGSVRDTIDKTLQWAAMPVLAEAASRRNEFDHLGLVTKCGTLYLICSGDARSLITPLIRALASWVHYEAGLLGSGYRQGKLDPPLLMALDEVAVTCPIDLPGMMSDSAGKGILLEWVAHSISQLEQRWGKYGAQTIIATSGVLLLLGGIKNPETLELGSELSGTTDGQPVMPVDLLRMLPDRRALAIRVNLYPVVVKCRPYWKRTAYRWPLKYRQVIPVPNPRWSEADLPEVQYNTPVVTELDTVPEQRAAPDEVPASGSSNGHKPPTWIP